MGEIDVSDLKNEFEFVGIKVEENVLNKCLEMCVNYNIDAESFVEEWVAFSETNFKKLSPPNIKHLEILERKQFVDKKPNVALNDSHSGIKVYTHSVDSDTNKIINSYKSATSLAEESDESKSSNLKKQYIGTTNFSQKSSDKAACAPSVKYKERSDSREVLLMHGSKELKELAESQSNKYKCNVLVKLLNENEKPLAECKYMYEVIRARALALNNITERLGRFLIKKYHLDEPADGFIKYGSESFTTYGRIICEGNGHLNASSVILEGSMSFANGQTVTLNLKDAHACSLFPGQVVAMQTVGQAGKKHTLLPTAIYSDATLNLPSDLPKIQDCLHIIFACGPYTLNDNLVYEPLTDLINYVVEKKPQVLILCGPFVDGKQPCVRDGSLAESFYTHFVDLIDTLMDQLQGLSIQVVLVASLRDAHHHSVYPTFPYKMSKRYSNLHLVSDPSVLNVDGLTIGMTTVDVLFHMAKLEMYWQPSNTNRNQDRMSRLATNILSQQSFYPLHPPAEKLPVDYELLEKYAVFDATPHILLLPSNLRYFVKNINGCVVINPERLTKGLVGGTFADIKVFPSSKTSVEDSIFCEIIKI